MKRQTAINEKLMRLQRKEMTAIREWMTNTEDKISRFVWHYGICYRISYVCFCLVPNGSSPSVFPLTKADHVYLLQDGRHCQLDIWRGEATGGAGRPASGV